MTAVETWGAKAMAAPPDPDAAGSGLDDLALERNINAPNKSEKEIEALHVDESVQGLQRAIHILRALKTSDGAINVPRLLGGMSTLEKATEQDGNAPTTCFSCIKAILQRCDISGHVAVGEAFVRMAPQLRAAFVEGQLLPFAAEKTRMESAAGAAWQDVVLVCIPAISCKVLLDLVWPLTLASSWMTETLAVRTFACKLLETVARRCAARGEPVPPDYTKALNTISDDTHPVVRAAAAQTVPVAAEHPDLGRDCMLAYQQRLTAMLADKDDDVRAAAVLALAQLLERLETAELSAVATPLYRAYTAVRGVQGEAMAHAFGLVFYHLRGHLSAKQTAQLLVYYNTLCASDSSSHCYWAAYNLPAVVTMVAPTLTSEKQFAQHVLAECLGSLAGAQSPIVRQTLAVGLHEVVIALGPELSLAQPVVSVIMSLLQDDDTSVVNSVVVNLDKTLASMLAPASRRMSQMSASNLRRNQPAKTGLPLSNGMRPLPLPLLASCCRAVERLTNRWRPLKTLLHHMKRFDTYFSPEHLSTTLAPVLQRIMLNDGIADGVVPDLVDAYLGIAKSIRKLVSRAKLLDWLVMNLARSEDCYHRRLFLSFCSRITVTFSRQFFKDNFFEHVLAFCEDPVLDVRRSAVRNLYDVKKMLVLPMDHQLLKELENATSSLNEGTSNKAWKAFVSQQLKEMDTIHNPITWSLDALFEDYELDQARQHDEEAVATEFEAEIADVNGSSGGGGGGSGSGSGIGSGMACASTASGGCSSASVAGSSSGGSTGASGTKTARGSATARRDSLFRIDGGLRFDDSAFMSPGVRRRSLLNVKMVMGGPETGALRGLLSAPLVRRTAAAAAAVNSGSKSARRGGLEGRVESGNSPSARLTAGGSSSNGSASTPTSAAASKGARRGNGRRRINTVSGAGATDGPGGAHLLSPPESSPRAALYSKSMHNLPSASAMSSAHELPRLSRDEPGSPGVRTPRRSLKSPGRVTRGAEGSNGNGEGRGIGNGQHQSETRRMTHRRTSSAGSPPPDVTQLRSVSTTNIQAAVAGLDLGGHGRRGHLGGRDRSRTHTGSSLLATRDGAGSANTSANATANGSGSGSPVGGLSAFAAGGSSGGGMARSRHVSSTPSTLVASETVYALGSRSGGGSVTPMGSARLGSSTAQGYDGSAAATGGGTPTLAARIKRGEGSGGSRKRNPHRSSNSTVDSQATSKVHTVPQASPTKPPRMLPHLNVVDRSDRDRSRVLSSGPALLRLKRGSGTGTT